MARNAAKPTGKKMSVQGWSVEKLPTICVSGVGRRPPSSVKSISRLWTAGRRRYQNAAAASTPNVRKKKSTPTVPEPGSTPRESGTRLRAPLRSKPRRACSRVVNQKDEEERRQDDASDAQAAMH